MDVSTSEQLHIFSRLLIAGGLGAVIGLEREIRGYPAGIRTIGLVALGASLFTDVSQLFSDASTSRVASNIVVGIGFIGGITSAATIWAAAAIGMAIGLSLYVVGVLGAVLIVVALEARPLTRRLDRVLYRWLGELSEKEADEELGVAWRRTRDEWEKEQGE